VFTVEDVRALGKHPFDFALDNEQAFVIG